MASQASTAFHIPCQPFPLEGTGGGGRIFVYSQIGKRVKTVLSRNVGVLSREPLQAAWRAERRQPRLGARRLGCAACVGQAWARTSPVGAAPFSLVFHLVAPPPQDILMQRKQNRPRERERRERRCSRQNPRSPPAEAPPQAYVVGIRWHSGREEGTGGSGEGWLASALPPAAQEGAPPPPRGGQATPPGWATGQGQDRRHGAGQDGR